MLGKTQARILSNRAPGYDPPTRPRGLDSGEPRSVSPPASARSISAITKKETLDQATTKDQNASI